MIDKQISKITMLTCLMLGGLVNAQEFYTCVPKKSWWVDTMGESIRNNVPSANDIAKAINNPKNKPSTWRFLKKIKQGEPIYLQQGKYKISCSYGANFFSDFVFFEVTVPSNLFISESEGNLYIVNHRNKITVFLPYCEYLYVLE